jgi:BioD-like phosphotransacetylase family protein
MAAPRKLFIAATSQDDGKTTIALGLARAFRERAKAIGFIKPVGQRYIDVEGEQIDEDSVLVQRVCSLDTPLKDMSPVAIRRGFTREYLDDPDKHLPALRQMILDSYNIAAKGCGLVLVEGTGHAGVGSVFDLSNAAVARLLESGVIIVTRGGIGRPVDEIAVNRALFDDHRVPVLGVIANKVLETKVEQTRHYLETAFNRMGLTLLGVIPYVQRLTWPTMQQVAEALRAEILNGEAALANPVADAIVCAMTARNALAHPKPGSLVITPADRDDIILAVLSSHVLNPEESIAGIALTGGLPLEPQTEALIKRTQIPVLLVNRDTYRTAAAVSDLRVKIRENDLEKVDIAARIVREYVDLERIWDALA